MSASRILVSLGATVLLAACGGGDSGDSRADAKPSASPSAAKGTTLPKKDLTPGATFPDATKDVVCAADYAKAASKRERSSVVEVFKRYDLDPKKGGADRDAHVVDRLIPVTLGGSNALENSWPQPAAEVKAKNALERKLRRKVCKGTLPLAEAQKAFAENWVAAQERFSK